MSNELFAAWHPPAPVPQSGLDTVRSVLVAIENGRPLDSQSAAHLGTAIRLTLEALPTTVGPHLVGLDESQMVATLSYEVEKILYEMSATAAAFANAEARGC